MSTPSRWVPLSAAATLLLAIGGVFVAGQNERLDAAFAAQMAIDHTRCFESSQLEPGQLSAVAVEAAFQRDQGWSVAVPAVDELELQDARHCEYAQGGMAHLMYRRDGRPVSLFVLPETVRRNRDLEIMWHDAVIWSENNRTFVLVGQEGQAEMASVAASIRGVSR